MKASKTIRTAQLDSRLLRCVTALTFLAVVAAESLSAQSHVPIPFPDTTVGNTTTLHNGSFCYPSATDCSGGGTLTSITQAPPFTAFNLRLVSATSLPPPSCSGGTSVTVPVTLGPDQALCVDFDFAPVYVGPASGSIIFTSSTGTLSWDCTGNAVVHYPYSVPATPVGGQSTFLAENCFGTGSTGCDIGASVTAVTPAPPFTPATSLG